jgi:hypothetical protein
MRSIKPHESQASHDLTSHFGAGQHALCKEILGAQAFGSQHFGASQPSQPCPNFGSRILWIIPTSL